MNECPCEICLVKATCRSRVVRKHKSLLKKNHEYETLVVEYLEKCPMIVEYFGVLNKKIIHSYKKIHKVCKCMNVPDCHFIWYANEIGIYERS